jgi:hypothetical protein
LRNNVYLYIKNAFVLSAFSFLLDIYIEKNQIYHSIIKIGRNKSKDMAKNRIRLSESELKNIIIESVKKNNKRRLQ